jgi:hypothetical protein
MTVPEAPVAPIPEAERSVTVQAISTAKEGSRGYSRSGFYTLKTTLRTLGPRVIDRRTHLGKQLAAWKADLVRDLGGDVSTQQAAVIDLAVRTKLLLDSVDAWLLVQPKLVNSRKKALFPAVRERQVLADALARYMGQLGLERKAKDVPDLQTYLVELEQEKQREAEAASVMAEEPVEEERTDGADEPD